MRRKFLDEEKIIELELIEGLRGCEFGGTT
jgi:hypothetical protein